MQGTDATFGPPVLRLPNREYQPMNCAEFLAHYSQFRDGDLSLPDREALDSHLAGCPSCRRYDRVVTRGVDFLRETPGIRPREDLKERVRHSIYSLDDSERVRRFRPHAPSGGGAMALMAAAVLVIVVIWTPSLLDDTPSVDLPTLVVDSSALDRAEVVQSSEPMMELGRDRSASFVYESDLWTGSNALLFEHSPLYHRYRDPALVQTGLH
jgi:hypothetical protein